MISLHDKEI